MVEVSSGEEAVELLAEDAFALAILDIRMAGMDGFELRGKISSEIAGPFLRVGLPNRWYRVQVCGCRNCRISSPISGRWNHA
jgi:hypothetical protein